MVKLFFCLVILEVQNAIVFLRVTFPCWEPQSRTLRPFQLSIHESSF